MEQLQLPLFVSDDTDRNAAQLVAIREYLTCWTEAERARRLADVKSPQRDRLGNTVGSRLAPVGGSDVTRQKQARAKCQPSQAVVPAAL